MQNKEKDTGKSKIDELFDQLKADDQKALQHLFSIYFHRLNDFAKHVIKDDDVSQDIVQEVFVKVWEKRAVIRNINLEAFLFRLVRNGCIDYIKQLRLVSSRMQEIKISSEYEELYRIDFVGNEPYLIIEKELKARIDNTIQKLPDRCREVFILSRIDGMKNKEIAEKLNISIKNVERHLNRALKSFREDFSEEFSAIIIVLILSHLKF